MSKKHLIYLANIAGIILLAILIHIIVDKPVHNSTNQDVHSAISVESSPNPNKQNGDVKGESTSLPVLPTSTPSPENNDDGRPCGEGSETAGWKILSCDPLRIMPLAEWNEKSASANFRYRPELYCFDESNFPGIFHEVEPVDFPDANWLSEMKLSNGCSFFFHPNQGMGNMSDD